MSRPAKSSGLGCLAVVGIVFIVLKLLAVPPAASWSWLWVLCPFWIGLALDIVLILLGLILNSRQIDIILAEDGEASKK